MPLDRVSVGHRCIRPRTGLAVDAGRSTLNALPPITSLPPFFLSIAFSLINTYTPLPPPTSPLCPPPGLTLPSPPSLLEGIHLSHFKTPEFRLHISQPVGFVQRLTDLLHHPDKPSHLMDPIISVYAELLLNICQLTISVSLVSPCNQTTTVDLSQDRKAIVIEHQAQRITAPLPAPLSRDAILPPRPLPRTKDLSFRLKVVHERDGLQPKRLEPDEDGIWPASSLTPNTRIGCRACKSVLLQDSVNLWKDLPSDNWAEMMDLWHCHKPNTEDDRERDAIHLAKGYAASSSLAPLPGCALVHLNYLRIHKSACIGLQVRRT